MQFTTISRFCNCHQFEYASLLGSQFQPIQILYSLFLNTQIFQCLRLRCVAKGRHEQGDGLVFLYALMIAPCLAHGVGTVVSF